MSSSEEYLDSLLKAAMENEEKTQEAVDVSDPNKALTADEIAAMFAAAQQDDLSDKELQEEDEEPEFSMDDLQEEDNEPEFSMDDLREEDEEPEFSMDDLREEDNEPETPMEDFHEEREHEELSVDNLLAGMGNDREFAGDSEKENNSGANDYSQDIAELLGSFGTEDEELAEINELLSQSDNENTVDEDMLALLENMSEENGSEYAEHLGADEPDEIDIFAMDAMNEEHMEANPAILEDGQEQAVAEDEIGALLKEKPKQKKEKKKWFGKRKDKKGSKNIPEEKQSMEEQSIEEQPEQAADEEIDIFGNELFGEDIFGTEGLEEFADSSEIGDIREKEPENQGFFSKMLHFLTEEEEEEQKEEPKKEKKKKKKDKKTEQAPINDENEAILEELAEEDKKGKKAKKAKKKNKKIKEVKKQSEPVKEEGKKLPKKIVIGIFAMCFSVMILLVIAAMLLPNLFSLQEARKAYYNRDYKQAYENLVGKNLNSSDSLMLEKTKTLMLLQRQYESFANYHKMGKELEALNALVKGCYMYISLRETAVNQNVATELDEIHTNILDSLEYMYGVSEEQALQLYILEDDYTYTKELEKILEGEDVITGGSEPAYRSDEQQ